MSQEQPEIKVAWDEKPKPEKQKKKKEKKPKGPPMAPVWKFYKYCNCLDAIFMVFGTIGTIIAGMGMPSFAFLFKELLNRFNPNTAGDELYSKSFDIRTSLIHRFDIPCCGRRLMGRVVPCICLLGYRFDKCWVLLSKRIYESYLETRSKLV